MATKGDLNNQAEEVQSKIIAFYADSKDGVTHDYKYWLEKYTQVGGYQLLSYLFAFSEENLNSLEF